MSKEKHKVMTAMFDIKPVDNSGNIDVSKIYEIQTVVNLGRKFRVTKGGIKFQSQKLKSRINSKTQTVKSGKMTTGEPKTEKALQEEFESFLNQDLNSITELASVGAEFHGEKYFKPRYKPIVATKFNESEERNASIKRTQCVGRRFFKKSFQFFFKKN